MSHTHGSGGRCTPERLKACRAACCHLPFHLTDDEAAAGQAKWHHGFPYHILQVGPDGRCFHLDPKTLRCGIYENRPLACRRFDCGESGIPALPR